MMNRKSCVPMPSTKIEIGTMPAAAAPKHVDQRPEHPPHQPVAPGDDGHCKTDHDGNRQPGKRAHGGRAETRQEVRRTQQIPFGCRDGRQPGKAVGRNSAGPRQSLPA